jgi:hypothetical protein
MNCYYLAIIQIYLIQIGINWRMYRRQIGNPILIEEIPLETIVTPSIK